MDSTDPMPPYQWGPLAIDPDTRVIANAESKQQKYVSKNELVLLQCLIEGPQAKENLIQRIWFDLGLVVTDASYYQLVAQLRNSLAEIGLPKSLVRTIPRYGLELVGPKDTPVETGGGEEETDGGKEEDTGADPAAGAPQEDVPQEDVSREDAPLEDAPAQDIPPQPAAPRPGRRWWQRLGRKEVAVLLTVLALSVLVAAGAARYKSGTGTPAVTSVAWVRHKVAQADVNVDGQIANDELAFYIGAIERQARLVGAGDFENYYLRRKLGVVEVLGCAKNNSTCVTYYFY